MLDDYDPHPALNENCGSGLGYADKVLYYAMYVLHFGLSKEEIARMESLMQVLYGVAPSVHFEHDVETFIQDKLRLHDHTAYYYCSNCNTMLNGSTGVCPKVECPLYGVNVKRAKASQRVEVHVLNTIPQLEDVIADHFQEILEVHHQIHHDSAQQALFGIPRWNSEFGCSKCFMRGKRLGAAQVWFDEEQAEVQLRSPESYLKDGEAGANGVPRVTAAMKVMAPCIFTSDALHMCSEGITTDRLQVRVNQSTTNSSMEVIKKYLSLKNIRSLLFKRSTQGAENLRTLLDLVDNRHINRIPSHIFVNEDMYIPKNSSIDELMDEHRSFLRLQEGDVPLQVTVMCPKVKWRIRRKRYLQKQMESQDAVRPGKTPAIIEQLNAHEYEGTVCHVEFDSAGATRDESTERRERIASAKEQVVELIEPDPVTPRKQKARFQKGRIRRMRSLRQVSMSETLTDGSNDLPSRQVLQARHRRLDVLTIRSLDMADKACKLPRARDKEKPKALIASLRQWGCKAVGTSSSKEELALDSDYDVTEDVEEIELKDQRPIYDASGNHIQFKGAVSLTIDMAHLGTSGNLPFCDGRK
ncbi:unnamed protein product [Heligmosomoides polygyrus]|uniref:ATP-dependent DNA helicase n=1 Tax=Heligmosomoides polygyrus TaxID=6339 RepID=A0A183G237_HELPZ|nr:unnamed protein product [Heligmosomoides polygyrus]